MTVLLVLAVFALFIAIDYLRTSRKPAKKIVVQAVAETTPRTQIVAGFRLAPNRAYHPGHTWAAKESPDVVRVGIDDFAARVLGKLDAVSLPQRGRWVTQGQKAASLQHGNAIIDMVSPIEGTVLDVNEAVLCDPELARRDPYGDGWLMLINAPEVKAKFRNLLTGSLAKAWLEDSAMRLQDQVAPAMADGGMALETIESTLPPQEWQERMRDFFLA
jgi:glycine cleavage system H protein